VAPPLPFDRVEVQNETGVQRLTAEQFLATPLADRVTWLLEQRMSFFLGAKPVDSRVALMALRARSVAPPHR
jgi:hypothetical protein